VDERFFLETAGRIVANSAILTFQHDGLGNEVITEGARLGRRRGMGMSRKARPERSGTGLFAAAVKRCRFVQQGACRTVLRR
jgi:hypothetical protein